MARSRSSTALTGAAGTNFEDRFAARFLLDMLSGTAPLDAELGRLTRIDWQNRASGWLLDDLVLTFEGPTGGQAGVSIKRDRKVTGERFDTTFVSDAWEQWLGLGNARPIRENQDAVVLVVGELANETESAWRALRSSVRETTPDVILARLQPPTTGGGSDTSEVQRNLFNSFKCPTSLRQPTGTDDLDALRLLRHVYLVYLDFRAGDASRDLRRAVEDCRRVLRSGDPARAGNLWAALVQLSWHKREHGGGIDLPGLVSRLRQDFDLRDHPDHEADWNAIGGHTSGRLEDIRLVIGDAVRWRRKSQVDLLRQHVRAKVPCLVVGDSGVGKSALARRAVGGRRIIWLTADQLERGTRSDLERELGIRHSLIDLVRRSSMRCAIIFDGAEGYTDRGLSLLAQLVRDILALPSRQRPGVLITCQPHALSRLYGTFLDAGVAHAHLACATILPPSDTDVRQLVRRLPLLQNAGTRPEFRAILRNLKVFDWAARLAAAGGLSSSDPVSTFTALLDRIWDRFVLVGDDKYARSGLLKRMAQTEAEALSPGVPESVLGAADLHLVPPLEQANLVRRRDERLRFSHDLLGDWARLKLLVEKDPTTDPATAESVAAVRWHRAVRLYAQRLLEQDDRGVERWRDAVARLGRAEGMSPTARTLRGLFLEGIVLCDGAADSLRRVWPALVEGDGELLRALLDRFRFAATVPDPRFQRVAQDARQAAEFAAEYRVPFVPYWVGLLQVLSERIPDVIRVARGAAARVCNLWLQHIPHDWPAARPMREQAARVAVAVAQEVYAREDADGFGDPDEERRASYEAALHAAPEFPDEVATLCLELARRRDESPAIRERRLAAEREAEARARAHPLPELPPGFDRPLPLLRPPGSEEWPAPVPAPHAPRDRVDDAFEDVCLGDTAILPLTRHRPAEAAEILLAVCSEPSNEDPPQPGYVDSEHYGLVYRPRDYPTFYTRGPYLALFRENPDVALTFALRLVNFTTRRWREWADRDRLRNGEPPREGPDRLTVLIGGTWRVWDGDDSVYRWHSNWPVECHVIQSLLMALEKWLYDEIDAGHEVTRWIERLLAEGESTAFAGVLTAVGKRHPDLLHGVLRPLLSSWELYRIELQIRADSSSATMWRFGWRDRHPNDLRIATEWHTMPHREVAFFDRARELMFTDDGRGYFALVRAGWQQQLGQTPFDDVIGRTTLLLTPEAYREVPINESQVLRVPQLPDEMRVADATAQRNANAAMRMMTFPYECRQRLDNHRPLATEEIEPFWQFLQSVERDAPAALGDETPVRPADLLCGGIGVLIRFHLDWLRAVPEREEWCRAELARYLNEPPPRLPFEMAESVGDRHWDTFAAECGVLYLAEDPNDELARALVACGVTAFRYTTVAATMRTAFRCRDRLGTEFDRMQALAVEWSGVRFALERVHRSHADHESFWQQRCGPLLEQFVDGTLPSQARTIRAVNAEWREYIERSLAATHAAPGPASSPSGPDVTVPVEPPQQFVRFGARRNRGMPGVDPRYLMRAFGWLDEPSLWSDQPNSPLQHLTDLLTVSIETVPKSPSEDAPDPLPADFDHWVFRLIGLALPRLPRSEQRTSLWSSVVERGLRAPAFVRWFLADSFLTGVHTALSPAAFGAVWAELIQFALAHPNWEPGRNRYRNLEEIVSELLGLSTVGSVIGDTLEYSPVIASLRGEYEAAAARWFELPQVAHAFARFIVRPAAASLLAVGVEWLFHAAQSWDQEEWRERRASEPHVAALRACWERHRDTIASRPELRAAFQGLLNLLTAQGFPAALALAEQVANTTG